VINGNTIVNVTDVYPQEYTSSTHTGHTGSTGSWEDGTTSVSETFYEAGSQQLYSDAVRSTYTASSLVSHSYSTKYNEDTPNYKNLITSRYTSQAYTGNVLGETFYEKVSDIYNNAQTWPFTPYTYTTIVSESIDSTRRTTYLPTTYIGQGTTTMGLTSFYTDTDTVATNGSYPIITTSITGTGTDTGTTFVSSTASKTDLTTSSTRRTITTDTKLTTHTFNSSFTLGQTTISCYWADYNERLAYVLPVSGYPKDFVDWTQAYSDLGTKIDAGASFPAEGANFLTSVYDTQTEILTLLKTTTTNTTSFQDASNWIPYTATVNYRATSSSTRSTTYQDESTDTNGKLLVYSTTKTHTYTDTYHTVSNIPITISLTTATVSSYSVGFYTEKKSKLGDITYSLSGGIYILSKNGEEITYLTTYFGSINSVDSYQLASLARLSTQYTYEEELYPPPTYYGGLTSKTSDIFYSDYQSYLSAADSTVTAKKYYKSDMYSVSHTTSAIPFAQAFGLAQTYQTDAGITPSTDMSYSLGWGLGFSIPANLSFVDFTTSSVYNGGVMLTTTNKELVSASQSLNSVSATTSATSNITLGTGTDTTVTSTTDASLTSSYASSFNTQISWNATHYTNNLILAGEGEASFANNGFNDNVSLHIRGVYNFTSFDSTGGNLSSYRSTYDGNNTISITGGDGLVIYKGGSRLLTLGFSSVASTFRGITNFTKT
jgi:hypothetical protein